MRNLTGYCHSHMGIAQPLGIFSAHQAEKNAVNSYVLNGIRSTVHDVVVEHEDS